MNSKYIAYIPKTIRLGAEMSFTINVLDHVDSEIKFESFLNFPDHNYTSVDVVQPGHLRTSFYYYLFSSKTCA